MARFLTGRRAAFCKNAALCAAAVIAAVALAEGALHLLPHHRNINHRNFYEKDPLLGWKKKAGAQRSIKTAEFTATEVVNSRGMRGEEYPYEKSQGVYRILVLGDSFAEGYTVNDEDLFSQILQNKLNNLHDGRQYQVINAGTVGYSTDQELLFFETEGKKYLPDLVALLFYENDVLENISVTEMYSKYKPLFRIVDDRLVLEKAPAEGSEASPPQDQTKNRPFLQSRLQRLLLFRLIKEQLIRLGVLNIQNDVDQSDKRYFEILARQDNPDVEYAWTLTTRLLQRLQESVSAAGARLVVFYIPSVYALDDQVWAVTSKRFGLEQGRWDLRKPETRLANVCRALGIPFWSLGDVFRSRAEEMRVRPSFFYHVEDGHWNRNGHAQAAQAMFDSLASLNALEPSKSATTRGAADQ